MFIKYKNQQVINIKNIIDIFVIDSNKDFNRHQYCQAMGKLYLIQFRSIGMEPYSIWLFSTKEERDDVYKKVLKTIEVKEISLSSEEPPIELMETV